jgi:hypothetical protein
VVHVKTFLDHEDVETSITEPAALHRQLAQPGAQFVHRQASCCGNALMSDPPFPFLSSGASSSDKSIAVPNRW